MQTGALRMLHFLIIMLPHLLVLSPPMKLILFVVMFLLMMGVLWFFENVTKNIELVAATMKQR
jgi:hypothetical protein